MGRREVFEGSVSRKRRSPARKQTSHHKWVWVPKIPSWEKEYCYRVGLFTWDKFLQAKKLTEFQHRILEWDDSAAKEAFDTSKKMFYAKINGQDDPGDSFIPDPNLYINEIELKDHDEVNSELLQGLGPAVDDREEQDDDCAPEYSNIRIEDIKPTGWDFDVQDSTKELTGLIVGR